MEQLILIDQAVEALADVHMAHGDGHLTDSPQRTVAETITQTRHFLTAALHPLTDALRVVQPAIPIDTTCPACTDAAAHVAEAIDAIQHQSGSQ